MTTDDMEFEGEFSSKTPLLDKFKESFPIADTALDESGVVRSSRPEIIKAAYAVDFPQIIDYMNRKKMNRETVLKAIESIPEELRDPAETVRGLINAFSHPEDQEPEEGTSVYEQVVLHLCAEVATDIEHNNGDKYRRLMGKAIVAVIAHASGNDDLKQVLEEEISLNPNDVESLLAKTSIFYMASVLHKENLALLKRADDVGGRSKPAPDDLIS